jgi:hypothetical protein
MKATLCCGFHSFSFQLTITVMSKTTTETLTITIPITTATAQTFTKKMSSEYKQCTGIIGYIIKQNAADKVRIELQTKAGSPIFESVHQDEVIGSTSVPSDFRYKTVNFDTAGNDIKVVVTPIAALAGAFEMDLVFKVTKD